MFLNRRVLVFIISFLLTPVHLIASGPNEPSTFLAPENIEEVARLVRLRSIEAKEANESAALVTQLSTFADRFKDTAVKLRAHAEQRDHWIQVYTQTKIEFNVLIPKTDRLWVEIQKAESREMKPSTSLSGLDPNVKKVGKSPAPSDGSKLPPRMTNNDLEDVWSRISTQLGNYRRLETLTGMERARVANELVFGLRDLETDVETFLRIAPRDDPRRSEVMRLKRMIDSSRSRNR